MNFDNQKCDQNVKNNLPTKKSIKCIKKGSDTHFFTLSLETFILKKNVEQSPRRIVEANFGRSGVKRSGLSCYYILPVPNLLRAFLTAKSIPELPTKNSFNYFFCLQMATECSFKPIVLILGLNERTGNFS